MSAGGPAAQVIDGRFELIERLGGGGMGLVWRARDTVLQREVALKEVRTDEGFPDDDPIVAHVMRERVLREARALARLHHPNVVTIYHIVDSAGHRHPWLVMELVTGGTLADRTKLGPMPAQQVARIGRGVLAALRAAHAAGIQHRDVKPANVLLRADGTPVLTDFGIAALRETTALTATGSLIGSPEYIAPERIRGQEGDPASDLWSLGMMLYVAVEGHNPLRRETSLATLAAVLDTPLPAPSRAGALAPVLAAVLQRDPAARPDHVRLDQMLSAAEQGEIGALYTVAHQQPYGSQQPYSSLGGRLSYGQPSFGHDSFGQQSFGQQSFGDQQSYGKSSFGHSNARSLTDAFPSGFTHGQAQPQPQRKRRAAAFAVSLTATAVVAIAVAVLLTLHNANANANGSTGDNAGGSLGASARASVAVKQSAGTSGGSDGGGGQTAGTGDGGTDTSGSLLTPAAMRKLVSDYKARFGTTVVLELDAYSNYAVVEVQPKSDPSVYDEYRYDAGTFSKEDGLGGTVDSDLDVPIDLKTLNFTGLPALISDGEKNLKIQHPTMTYLVIEGGWFSSNGAIGMYLADDYGGAYDLADKNCKVIERYPRE